MLAKYILQHIMSKLYLGGITSPMSLPIWTPLQSEAEHFASAESAIKIARLIASTNLGINLAIYELPSDKTMPHSLTPKVVVYSDFSTKEIHVLGP